MKTDVSTRKRWQLAAWAVAFVLVVGVGGFYVRRQQSTAHAPSTSHAEQPAMHCPLPSTTGVFIYNRCAAVAWAMAHVRDQQSISWSQDAWFVSNALWAGGYPQTTEWNGRNRPKGTWDRSGTITANTNTALVDYLRAKGLADIILLPRQRLSENALAEAAIGDILVYLWDGETIGQVSLIVDFAKGSYPEVAEWGTVSLKYPIVTKQTRGWTWSNNRMTWLQKLHPDMEVVLVRMKG